MMSQKMPDSMRKKTKTRNCLFMLLNRKFLMNVYIRLKSTAAVFLACFCYGVSYFCNGVLAMSLKT